MVIRMKDWPRTKEVEIHKSLLLITKIKPRVLSSDTTQMTMNDSTLVKMMRKYDY